MGGCSSKPAEDQPWVVVEPYDNELMQYPWFIGKADRRVIERGLQDQGIPGDFVVRNSSKVGCYAMSVLVNKNHVLHTLISASGDNTWYIPQANGATPPVHFVGVPNLVNWYALKDASANANGMTGMLLKRPAWYLKQFRPAPVANILPASAPLLQQGQRHHGVGALVVGGGGINSASNELTPLIQPTKLPPSSPPSSPPLPITTRPPQVYSNQQPKETNQAGLLCQRCCLPPRKPGLAFCEFCGTRFGAAIATSQPPQPLEGAAASLLPLLPPSLAPSSSPSPSPMHVPSSTVDSLSLSRTNPGTTNSILPTTPQNALLPTTATQTLTLPTPTRLVATSVASTPYALSSAPVATPVAMATPMATPGLPAAAAPPLHFKWTGIEELDQRIIGGVQAQQGLWTGIEEIDVRIRQGIQDKTREAAEREQRAALKAANASAAEEAQHMVAARVAAAAVSSGLFAAAREKAVVAAAATVIQASYRGPVKKKDQFIDPE